MTANLDALTKPFRDGVRTFFARPPRHPAPLSGPGLVVGSAPAAHLPAGFDPTWTVISINGSQARAAAIGAHEPDITVMMFNQVKGRSENAVAVRAVLKGKATGHLVVVGWRHGRTALVEGLAAMDYRYRSLASVSRHQRAKLVFSMLRMSYRETETEEKISNGIVAILYALSSGVRPVVITGINPRSSGHFYNDLNLARKHVGSDGEALARMVSFGYPVFTADPEVAEASGLPLWTGEDKAAD